MAPHLILEELQVDFELITVDRKSNGQKSADYVAINPAGRIPTLVDNGLTVFESPAICVHLAENHPSANLIPSIGERDRALFFQWLMYLTNTLQAELMVYFYPQKHTLGSNNLADIVQAQEQLITDALVLLDRALEGKNYLVGESVTACDYFLFMLCVWADELQRPPLSFANLSRYLRRLAQRDAVIKVCAKENLSLKDYQ